MVPNSSVEPARTSGGSTDRGVVPQILCTAGPMMSARPKVTSATSMWLRRCSGRSTASSNAAPTTASASGTITSAAQKLKVRLTEKPRYAPSM